MPIKDLHPGAQKDRLQVELKFLQGSFFFSPGIWWECAEEVCHHEGLLSFPAI